MSATTIERPRNRQLCGNVLQAVSAWAVASIGIMQGFSSLWVAFLILLLPMIGFLITGYLAERGAVIACLISAFGAAFTVSLPGGNPVIACGLIGAMNVFAATGGIVANRLRPMETSAVTASASAASNGRRTTIVVEVEASSNATEDEARRRLATPRTGERPKPVISLVRSA